MKRCIIVRGSSGSGKSWLANELLVLNQTLSDQLSDTYPMAVIATDDFWTEENPWNRKQVEEAHEWNKNRIRRKMEAWKDEEECTIIIPNTLPIVAYIMPILRMCIRNGFEVQMITMQRELRVCAA